MKNFMVFIMGIVALTLASAVSAEQGSWGAVFKSAAQAAGQAAVQQMSPQAQTAVDQAKKLGAGAPQENFLVTKAKEYMAAGNYQSALDLANYVITAVNSKSVDAKKIMADAKAALLKMAQDKVTQSQPKAAAVGQQGQAKLNTAQQIKTDAANTVTGVKSLFGTQK